MQQAFPTPSLRVQSWADAGKNSMEQDWDIYPLVFPRAAEKLDVVDRYGAVLRSSFAIASIERRHQNGVGGLVRIGPRPETLGLFGTPGSVVGVS